MNKIYTPDFYIRNKKNQKALADKIVPFLAKHYSPMSVVDFGCGSAKFLREIWNYMRYKEFFPIYYKGIDNHNFSKLMEINIMDYKKHDLSKPINLKHKFDLVISLEVAEHLPNKSAKIFIETLVKHARNRIMFSAATPGQGGDGHINEQPHEYWHNLFRNHGFKPDDCIQKLLKGDKSVPFWYRRNIFVYEKTI